MAHANADYPEGSPEKPSWVRPEPLRRHPETERIEKICDTIVLVLLVSVLVLAPIAFGGVAQDLAPFSKTPFGTVLYYFNYYIVAAAVLMGLAWAVKLVLTERIVLARTPMDVPLLLFLLYALVRALTCAAPTVGLREVGWMAAYAAIFYVAVNTLRTRRQQGIAAGAIVATALLITLIAFVMALHSKTSYLALTLEQPEIYRGRLSTSYVCPNHYAGHLEMAIPLVLGFIMISKARPVAKIVAGALGFALILGMILSMSRGGWVGLALGTLCLFIVAIKQRRTRFLAWLLPPALIAIVATTVIVRDPRVREKFLHPGDTYYFRGLTWKHTLDVVREHPLFGTGPGTYRWAITKAQPARMWVDVRYAHNDYLHTLSDYGVIGLGLVLWAVGAFAFRGVRALRRLKKSSDLALTASVLAAAAAIAAHSFVDFNMRIPANLVTMLVLAALLIAVRQYQLRRLAELVIFKRGDAVRLRPITKGLAIAAFVLVAAALLVVNGRKHEARIAYHRGRELDASVFKGIAQEQTMSPERAERVVTAYQRAVRLDPSNDEFRAALLNFYLWKGANDGVSPWTMAFARQQLEYNLEHTLKTTPSLQLPDLSEKRARVIEEQSRPERIFIGLLLALRAQDESLPRPKIRKEAALNALEKAIAYGKEAFRLNPLSAKVAFEMGKTYALIYGILTTDGGSGTPGGSAHLSPEECKDQARHWYRLTVELFPENGAYRRSYGEFFELIGELNSALVQYEKGFEIYKDAPWSQKIFIRCIQRVQEKIAARREAEAAEQEAGQNE